MDRIEAMQIFITVAKEGGFSAASRKLGIPIATVSRKVSDLEEYLGVKLLNRTTRKLELTDMGRTYLTSSEGIIEKVVEAEQIVMGEYQAPKGKLFITAPVVFGKIYVLPLVCEFLKSYPDIKIQLLLTDTVVNMIEENIDLSLRIGHLPDSTMIAAKVGETKLLTCASPAYLASHGTPKKTADLKDHECISIEPIGSSTLWKYEDKNKKITTSIEPRLVVSNIEAGIGAAISGVGITRVFSYHVQRDLENKSLKSVLRNFESDPLPINFLYLGSRQTPQKLRAFLDYMTPKLKKTLKPV